MRVLALLSLLLAVAACEYDNIKVTIEPRPDGSFVRTIRLWKTDSEQPGVILAPRAELVAAAQHHYGEEIDTGDAARAFRGTFREVPADVAGKEGFNHGGFDVWSSRLGSIGVYRERKPGPTDFHARIERLSAAVNDLSRLAVAGARRQLDGEEGLEKLVAFLDGPFRTDLKDVLVLLAGSAGRQDLFDVATEEAAQSTARSSSLALALQLLVERGWFAVRDLPVLGARDGGPEFLMRIIARHMGRPLDDGLRARLRFLENEEEAARIGKAVAAEAHVEPEALGEAVTPILDELVSLDFGTDARLTYELILPAGAEVTATSGLRGGTGSVTWGANLDDRPVKTLFFCMYALPDRAWQEQHFGRVVIAGEHLWDYVLWLESLASEARATWEAALEGVSPGPDLPEKLAAIRVTPRAEGEKDEPEKGALIFKEAHRPG